MCGGTFLKRRYPWLRVGLSPRVRGNLLLPDVGLPSLRSIPACAGEPLSMDLAAMLIEVYPRVCGGTSLASPGVRPARGLSPRVRGNRPALRRLSPCSRSIPACAGEPASVNASVLNVRVYPRVCGGTFVARTGDRLPTGLSPRVRGNPRASSTVPSLSQVYPRVCGGTREPRRPFPHCHRSIPACAGEPAESSTYRGSASVYPRVCGGTIPLGSRAII